MTDDDALRKALTCIEDVVVVGDSFDGVHGPTHVLGDGTVIEIEVPES